MSWLDRLERALEERLEPIGDHPYEQALAIWRLVLAHPRPGGFAPNRWSVPRPLSADSLDELRAHLDQRGFRLAAPLHQVLGPLGVSYARSAQDPPARILVVVLDGPSAGKVGLAEERLVIGRGPEVDLRLGDPSVSRRHCSLAALSDRSLELVDLGSRLGLSVEGRRVAQARLKSPACFSLGAQTLQAHRLD